MALLSFIRRDSKQKFLLNIFTGRCSETLLKEGNTNDRYKLKINKDEKIGSIKFWPTCGPRQSAETKIGLLRKLKNMVLTKRRKTWKWTDTVARYKNRSLKSVDYVGR